MTGLKKKKLKWTVNDYRLMRIREKIHRIIR